MTSGTYDASSQTVAKYASFLAGLLNMYSTRVSNDVYMVYKASLAYGIKVFWSSYDGKYCVNLGAPSTWMTLPDNSDRGNDNNRAVNSIYYVESSDSGAIYTWAPSNASSPLASTVCSVGWVKAKSPSDNDDHYIYFYNDTLSDNGYTCFLGDDGSSLKFKANDVGSYVSTDSFGSVGLFAPVTLPSGLYTDNLVLPAGFVTTDELTAFGLNGNRYIMPRSISGAAVRPAVKMKNEPVSGS